MSVIFIDSPNSREGAQRWNIFTQIVLSAGVTPTGGDAYEHSQGTLTKAIPDTASVAAGWTMRFPSVSTVSQDNSINAQIFQVRSDGGATVHLTFTVTTAGEVRVRRGGGDGTLLATSEPGVIVLNSWADVEFRAVIADSGGRAEVWVNGVQAIDFTGDTKNGGTKTDIDTVRWGRCVTGSVQLADFRVLDSATPGGPGRVVSLKPVGAGFHTDFTPVGADNWENVDDLTPNGDTDYNHSGTEGDKDTFEIADLPAGNFEVVAVQSSINARRDDAGAKFIRPVLRIDGTDYVGASRALAESYQAFLDVWDVNPDTAAAFEPAEVNDLELGYEVRDS